jgi:hypothetical protein
LQHYHNRRASLNPVCVAYPLPNSSAPKACSLFMPYTVIYQLRSKTSKKMVHVFSAFNFKNSGKIWVFKKGQLVNS